MFRIGIFFGSDTGNTKNIAYQIYEKINKYFYTSIFDIRNSTINNFISCDILILGTSTWYCGELQYDWDIFLKKFKKINFFKKIICFFGCGDQKNYGNYFCDGIYKLYNIINKNNSLIIGYWPNKNYFFDNSTSLLNKNYFLGLIIDEVNQSKLTNKRINSWVSKLLVDLYNLNI